MKKFSLRTIIIALTIAALTACGTTNSSEPQTETQAPAEEISEPTDEQPEEVEEEQVTRLIDKQIQYVIEGEFQEESGFLHHNESGDYSLYLFEGYQLESEEPNKDIILGPNENNFIRIEVGDHKDIEALKESVKNMAESVDSDAFLNDTFQPTPFLENAVWYKAYTEEVAVSYILVTSTEQPMIITIHSPREGEYIQRSLAMVETIEFN